MVSITASVAKMAAMRYGKNVQALRKKWGVTDDKEIGTALHTGMTVPELYHHFEKLGFKITWTVKSSMNGITLDRPVDKTDVPNVSLRGTYSGYREDWRYESHAFRHIPASLTPDETITEFDAQVTLEKTRRLWVSGTITCLDFVLTNSTRRYDCILCRTVKTNIKEKDVKGARFCRLHKNKSGAITTNVILKVSKVTNISKAEEKDIPKIVISDADELIYSLMKKELNLDVAPCYVSAEKKLVHGSLSCIPLIKKKRGRGRPKKVK